MVQQGETDLSLILALGTSGMMLLAIFIVVFIILYQKKQIRQHLTHQQDLLSATIQTQEKERKRIAQDLHDSVGGTLSAAKLSINQAVRRIEDKDSKDHLNEAKKLIDETLIDTRKISHDLLPATLSEFGLVDALEEHCNKLDSPDVRLSFRYEGSKDRIEERTELALFRIVQELIQNALKHAEATQIEVTYEFAEGKVKISVGDNGKGFNITENPVRPKDGGLGLKNIESRVSMLNADINYNSEKGKGTKVTIVLQINLNQDIQDA